MMEKLIIVRSRQQGQKVLVPMTKLEAVNEMQLRGFKLAKWVAKR